MTLVGMFAGLVEYTVTGKGFDPNHGGITVKSSGEDASKAGDILATLGSAVLCSNTTVAIETDKDSPNFGKWTPKGNSSEAPLVVGGMKVGIKLEDMEKTLEPVKQGNIPFSSSRKMMVTVTKTIGEEKVLKHVAALNEHTAHVKGAPNFIMDKCTSYLSSDGSVQPMDDAVKKQYMDKVDELSSQALRVLAVATKPLGPSLPWSAEEEEDIETDEKFKRLTNELTLAGLCASIDPERDGVKDAVKTSRTAGCRVVMITGDYLKTAIAIAKNINILNRSTFVEGNGEATDCQALRPDKEGVYLEQDEFDKITFTTSVFARAKPEDKLEIVRSLQRQGFVCAMTGDGVNDAPALQKADIGVAMGLEGTEVAKGASDMILTDDNFCSIVDAIEQGRVIYAGIQKFVSFIMSVHFAEVMQIFLCIVCKFPVMRQPLQILFLILVTDLPPSIALGFEPGEPMTMKRRPRPKTQPIVLVSMWGGIIAHGMILTMCIFSTYVWALWAYADAFLTEDITDESRVSCYIWANDMWGPQRNLECLPVNGTFTNPSCGDCIDTSVRRARTCAFISLVWAEGLRAYVSRSFENGFWVGTFDNPSMNKAVLMAQVTLLIALFLPGFNEDVLGLYVYEIHYFGWIFALFGAMGCLLFCELFKCWASQYVEEAELANYSEDEDGNVVGVVVDEAPANETGTAVEMETAAYPPKNANVNVDLLPESEAAAGGEQPPELFSPTTGARM
jgi:magnesium-transporting ATPase (P-type)